MDKLIPGQKVKMSQKLKDILMENGCEEHVKEFGDCIGIVGDRFFDCPEFKVYWQPYNLNYLYEPEDLDEYIEKI
jgi:hypothetical protein